MIHLVAIVGVGIDLVDVGRFQRALTRSPGLAQRLFSAAEQGLKVESLAARFAAKEAVVKCISGASSSLVSTSSTAELLPTSATGFSWRDIIVMKDAGGAPVLKLEGATAARATALGITKWHVSLTHDAGIAAAVVIGETGF